MGRNEDEKSIKFVCFCFKFIYRFIFVYAYEMRAWFVLSISISLDADDFCCWCCCCCFYRLSQLFALRSSCVCLPVDRGIWNGVHDTAAINNSHLAFIIWNFLFTLQLVEMYKSNDGKCEGSYDKQKWLKETKAQERASQSGGGLNAHFFFFVLPSREGFTFRPNSFTLNNNLFTPKIWHSRTDLSNKI